MVTSWFSSTSDTLFPSESVIVISEVRNVKSARSAEYTAPSITKSIKPSPSTSEAERATTTSWSSAVWADALAATGATFTAFTVTVKLCEADNSPSLTVAINDSLPL